MTNNESPRSDMSMTLVEQIAEELGINEDGARSALDTFAGQIAHLVDTGGSLAIPGLGTFTESEGVLHFSPTGELAEAVNHRFAGLETLSVTRGDDDAASVVGDAATVATQEEVRLSDGIDSVESETEDEEVQSVFGDDPEEPLVDAEAVETPDDSESSEKTDLEWQGAFAEATDSASTETSSQPASDADDAIVDADEVDSTDASEDPSTKAPEPVLETAKAVAGRSAKETENTTSPLARLFVPLVGVLAIVAALLWFMNRSSDSASTVAQNGATGTGNQQTEQSGANDSENAGNNAQTDETTDNTTAEQDPVVEGPVWVPGQIDRTAGAYSIVVSSEPTRPEAEAIARSIATRLNQTTDVFVSTVNGATRYRVGVGQFGSSGAASRTLSQLADELPEGSWVLRIQPSM